MARILGAVVLVAAMLLSQAVLGVQMAHANVQQDEEENSCEPFTLDVVSDSTTQVNGGDAVELTGPFHPAWTADLEGNYPADGSKWIWEVDGVSDPVSETVITFTRDFSWDGDTINSATLYLASDNSHEVALNAFSDGDPSEDNHRDTTDDTYDVTGNVNAGLNTLEIGVTNFAQPGGTEDSNPAGLLYHLVIEGEKCPEPEPEPKVIGDDKVKNRNGAFVVNHTEASASTGGNYAGGARGGRGGDGGDIENEGGNQNVNDSDAGDGGDGGDATEGGTVMTGDATAGAKTANVVNTNVTRVDRCGCDGEGGDSEGDVKVKNSSHAKVFNDTEAKAKTGYNLAKGSRGGRGEDGGDIENEGGNQNVNGSDAGNGGDGGTGGSGGWVETGDAVAGSRTFNLVNTNFTRVRR